MTRIDAPVGLRDGVTPVASLQRDQTKIIALLWSIDIGNGGQRGTPATPPAPGGDRQCDPLLAAAIMAFQMFWVLRGEFRRADGVVDPGGNTLRKLDALAGKPAPPAPTPKPGFMDLKVLRIRQTLGKDMTDAHATQIPAVSLGSLMPFLFTRFDPKAKLREEMAKATIHELLFEIEKDGVTFWVGAAIPAGTMDFSRAYIYFHPDTMGDADNRTYKNFSGRWEEVRRYVWSQGTHMAAAKKIPLLVPFMTLASRGNTAGVNLFASQGVETISDIMTAIQMTLGRTGKFGEIQHVGVASFSSGVDHLFRFAQKVGGSGVIREQMDFDGANIIVSHKIAPRLSGCVNWTITQNASHIGVKSADRVGTPGWLYLPGEVWSEVGRGMKDVHAKIGFMMFNPMMILSAMA